MNQRLINKEFNIDGKSIDTLTIRRLMKIFGELVVRVEKTDERDLTPEEKLVEGSVISFLNDFDDFYNEMTELDEPVKMSFEFLEDLHKINNTFQNSCLSNNDIIDIEDELFLGIYNKDDLVGNLINKTIYQRSTNPESSEFAIDIISSFSDFPDIINNGANIARLAISSDFENKSYFDDEIQAIKEVSHFSIIDIDSIIELYTRSKNSLAKYMDVSFDIQYNEKWIEDFEIQQKNDLLIEEANKVIDKVKAEVKVEEKTEENMSFNDIFDKICFGNNTTNDLVNIIKSMNDKTIFEVEKDTLKNDRESVFEELKEFMKLLQTNELVSAKEIVKESSKDRKHIIAMFGAAKIKRINEYIHKILSEVLDFCKKENLYSACQVLDTAISKNIELIDTPIDFEEANKYIGSIVEPIGIIGIATPSAEDDYNNYVK